jgi:hypothetical protein
LAHKQNSKPKGHSNSPTGNSSICAAKKQCMFYGSFCHKRVSNYKFQPDMDMQVLTETKTSFSNNLETSGSVIMFLLQGRKKEGTCPLLLPGSLTPIASKTKGTLQSV